MASRKDLLKAQSFITGRLSSSFIDRDPDNPTRPLKRVTTGTFVGIMIGVLIVAGCGLFGFIRPGSGTLDEKGTLVTDVSSGLLFIYYVSEKDGPVLMPMADIASARLAMGSADISVVKTSRLQGITQDTMRGIPDAPRQLPSNTQMNPYPLRTCSTKPNSNDQRYITVEAGPADGSVPTTTAADDVAAVIETVEPQNAGNQFLVVNGVAHKLWRNSSGRAPAASTLPVLKAGDAWLASLPIGLPVEPLPINNRGGTPSSNQAQSDLRIGSVAMVEATEVNPQPRYFVQLEDGLAETSFLNMATELAYFDTTKTDPTKITPEAAEKATSLRNPVLKTEGIPMERPAAPESRDASASICATYVDPSANAGRTTPVITLGQTTPSLPKRVTDQPPSRAYADYIKMPSLNGVLLQDESIPVGNSSHGPTFLLSDSQVYGIPDAASREALGYNVSGKNSVKVLRVPSYMTKLLGEAKVKLSASEISPTLPADFKKDAPA